MLRINMFTPVYLEGVAYRFESSGAKHRLFLPGSILLERSDDDYSSGLNLGCGFGSSLTRCWFSFYRRLQAAPGVAADLFFRMF